MPDPQPGGPIDLPFALQGQFLLGQYTLHLLLMDSMSAGGSPDVPGVGGGGETSYTFDLSLLPEPASAVTWLIVMMLMACAARRRRREHGPSVSSKQVNRRGTD